jgi:hypothetical protein
MTDDLRAYLHAKAVIDAAKARGDKRPYPEILREEADRLAELNSGK